MLRNQLSKLQQECNKKIAESVLEFDQTRDLEKFANDLYRVLEVGHSQSWKLGRLCSERQRSGRLKLSDQINGRAIADSELDYLLAFMDTIAEGRYDNDDGTLKLNQIAGRAGMYVKRLKGTANEAFVVEGPEDAEYTWQLGVAEHCEDCIEFAANSPYLAYELSNFPGDGNTVCRVHCHCTLVRNGDPSITGF